jgi:hypothetical protein
MLHVSGELHAMLCYVMLCYVMLCYVMLLCYGLIVFHFEYAKIN